MKQRYSVEALINLVFNIDTDKQKWKSWKEHYLNLSADEQKLVRQTVAAANKIDELEWNTGLNLNPIEILDQNDVNNGCGIMFAIDRNWFPREGVKLCYVRDDMWIPPEQDANVVPDWILHMAEGCRENSIGLAKVYPEIILFSFDEDPPCNYYAVTFELDEKQIRTILECSEKDEPILFAIVGEISAKANYSSNVLLVTKAHMFTYDFGSETASEKVAFSDISVFYRWLGKICFILVLDPKSHLSNEVNI